MPTYSYTAQDRLRQQVTGQVSADGIAAARSNLVSRGLVDIHLSEEVSVFQKDFSIRPRRLRQKDVAFITRNLATTQASGLDIFRSLGMLAEMNSKTIVGERLADMQKQVGNGASLSQAMRTYEDEIGTLTISLIAAGEEGGSLDEALETAAALTEYELDVRRQIRSAMTYPITIIIFTTLIFFGLLTFVVPQFADIFSEFGGDLPALTQFTLSASDLARQLMWFRIAGSPIGVPILPLALVGAFFAVRASLKKPEIRFKFDQQKLRIPIFGAILMKSSISRITTTLSSLLKSGVPLLRALQLAGKTGNNKFYELKIEEARNSIKDGASLSKALDPKAWPPLMIQLIEVGESTSATTELLDNYTNVIQKEMKASIESVKDSIQPFILAIVGTLVGFLAVSILSPLFSFINEIQ